jgi:hypothetical protein
VFLGAACGSTPIEEATNMLVTDRTRTVMAKGKIGVLKLHRETLRELSARVLMQEAAPRTLGCEPTDFCTRRCTKKC